MRIPSQILRRSAAMTLALGLAPAAQATPILATGSAASELAGGEAYTEEISSAVPLDAASPALGWGRTELDLSRKTRTTIATRIVRGTAYTVTARVSAVGHPAPLRLVAGALEIVGSATDAQVSGRVVEVAATICISEDEPVPFGSLEARLAAPGTLTVEVNAEACALQDDDGDHIGASSDNCPQAANADQADFDGDGLGDACDGDIDADGVSTAKDRCPRTQARMRVDGNGCSMNQGLASRCGQPKDYARHSLYLSCVLREVNQAADAGRIAQRERRLILRGAVARGQI